MPGHAGLVDQDDVPGVEVEPRIPALALGLVQEVATGLVQELVQVLRPQVELGPEDLRGLGAGGERHQPATVGGQHRGVRLHRGGLARTGGADPDAEPDRVCREVLHQPPLAGIEGDPASGLVDRQGRLRDQRVDRAGAGEGSRHQRLLRLQDTAGGVPLAAVHVEDALAVGVAA